METLIAAGQVGQPGGTGNACVTHDVPKSTGGPHLHRRKRRCWQAAPSSWTEGSRTAGSADA
eukprot:9766456-Alexandrium_andersonii.AAC.1